MTGKAASNINLTHVEFHISTTYHSTAQQNTAQCSTAQHSTAQRSTAQRSAAQHSTAQHSTAYKQLVSTQVRRSPTNRRMLCPCIKQASKLVADIICMFPSGDLLLQQCLCMRKHVCIGVASHCMSMNTLHMLNSCGNGEKYQVSISYRPSSILSTFFTLVNSSCSLSAF